MYKQFVAVEVTECFTVASIVTELFWMFSLNLLQISVGVKYPTVCLKQTVDLLHRLSVFEVDLTTCFLVCHFEVDLFTCFLVCHFEVDLFTCFLVCHFEVDLFTCFLACHFEVDLFTCLTCSPVCRHSDVTACG